MSVEPFESIASLRSFVAASVALASIEIEMEIFLHDAIEHSGVVYQAQAPQRVGQ
jgi:hypothetical protein